MKANIPSTIISKMTLGYALHKFIRDENGHPYDYIYIDTNPAFEKYTGLKSDDIIGEKITEVIPEIINDKYNWIETYSEVAFEGKNIELEQYFHPLKKWYRIHAYQPEYGYFVTLIEDISESKNIKNRKELLQEELEVLKTISDKALYGKAIANTDGYLTYVNKFFANTHGYEPEELISKPISLLHTNKQLDKVNKLIKQLLEKGSFDQQEVWHKHKNGTEFPMSMIGIAIKDREGNPKYIATSAIDITEIKMMEMSLQEKEERLERMLSVVPDMISIQDTDMNILYSNWNGFADIPKEKRVLKSKCYKTYRNYDDICPDCNIQNFLEEKVPFRLEQLLFDGRWLDFRVIPILDSKNNVEFFVEWVRDITKEKENEKRIKQLKKEFEIIFEGSQDSMFLVEVVDSETFIYVRGNSSGGTLTGISPKEIVGKTPIQVLGSEIGNDIIKHYKKCCRLKKPISYEAKRKFDTGEKNIFNVLTPIIINDEVKYLVGLNRDITKEKENFKEIERLKKEFQTVFEGSQDSLSLIEVIDSETFRFIQVNSAAGNLSGIPSDQFIGKTPLELFNDNDGNEIVEKFKECYKFRQPIHYEANRSYNNESRDVGVVLTPIIEDNDVKYIVACTRDVTEEKQYLRKLRNLSRDFETVFEGSQDVMSLTKVIDSETFIYSQVNKAVDELTGIPSEYYIGKTPVEVFDVKPGNDILKKYKECYSSRKTITYETNRKFATGTKYIRVVYTPIIENGKVRYIVGSTRDVSEDRENLNRVEKLKKDFEIIFEGSQDSMFLVEVIDSKTFVYIQANNVQGKITGIPSECFIGKTPVEVLGTKIGNDILNKYKKCYELRKPITYEAKREFVAGTIYLFNVLTPVIEDGEIKYLVGSSRDITEDKKNLRRIEYLSYHDQLTGLYNRRYFEEELKRLSKAQYLPLSIIMADLNGLKIINDGLGHRKGDEVLIKTGQVLINNTSENSIIARIGGDEFVILLPNTIYEKANNIKNSLEKACKEEDVSPVVLSVSFGVSTINTTDTNIEKKRQQAEDNMYHDKLQKSPSIRGETLNAILNALHEKNPLEERHNSRVSNLSEKIAIALELNSRDVSELKLAGLLHDIGKIAIDLSVLDKKERLSEEEWSIIQKHPEIGYRILSATSDMSQIGNYVLMHHERIDGKGYPQGLKGSEIPLQARVIAVADAYDAMTSYRSYKKIMSQEEAIEELKKCAGTQFDTELVNVFINKVLIENK